MNRLTPIAWLATPTLAASLLVACSTTPPAPVPQLPAALAVGPDEQWLATLPARGVQVYECRTGTGGTPAWAFVAPEAELLEPGGQAAGTHGAGPFWQALDGSRVEGQVSARADAPLAGSIPWLLLTTRSTGPAGRFDRVSRVRRIHTVGGVAPATGCDASTLQRQVRVPYSSDYLLYAQR